MTTVYLARHGQTEWNHGLPRYGGASDVDLNETGRAQAKCLASRLKTAHLDAIYSSPLKRAFETAQTVGDTLHLSVIVDEGFREIHYGAWEGLTHAEILARYGDVRARWEIDPAVEKPPGGETGIEVGERALASLKRILETGNHDSFLIVSHKTVHRLILCAALGIDPTEYRRRFSMGNAALSALEYGRDGFLLKLHNDKSHLAGLTRKLNKEDHSVAP
jgi:broad specificity phosphatase PhoE